MSPRTLARPSSLRRRSTIKVTLSTPEGVTSPSTPPKEDDNDDRKKEDGEGGEKRGGAEKEGPRAVQGFV